MATTSSTTKTKQDPTKTKSLIKKPKVPSSATSEDGSEQKPEKPLPNYLKPTISSRPESAKLLKKNNSSLEDNQRLLRRRSFDRPPSSVTSPSTSSSPQIKKSLNVSPSLPRDRQPVPKEKPATTLRSSSFHGSRGVPRGSTSGKSPLVGPKKSGLSTSSTSLKGKKEGSSNVTKVKTSDKEIPLDSASLASSAQEDDQEEILKVESLVHVAEEPKDEIVTQEVQVEALPVEVVQVDESGGNVSGGPAMVASSPILEDCVVVVVVAKEEEELINEDKTEEKIEETREHENNQDNKGEEEEEVLKKKIDDEHESPKNVDIAMKEVESVKETPEEIKEVEKEEVKEEEKEKLQEVEKEEVKEEEKEKLKEEVKDEEVKEEEKEKVKEEEKEKLKEEVKDEEVKEEEKEKLKEEVKDEEVKEEEKEKVKGEEKEKVKEEVKKKEVVKGNKGSPSAYNDVIASKMQENPRKNKVLALAGAFQTVIDYETTNASK